MAHSQKNKSHKETNLEWKGSLGTSIQNAVIFLPGRSGAISTDKGETQKCVQTFSLTRKLCRHSRFWGSVAQLEPQLHHLLAGLLEAFVVANKLIGASWVHALSLPNLSTLTKHFPDPEQNSGNPSPPPSHTFTVMQTHSFTKFILWQFIHIGTSGHVLFISCHCVSYHFLSQ